MANKQVQQFASQHLGLVRQVAHQLRDKYKADFDELVSLGTIGLMKAAARFDVSQQNKFSSYAVPYIRGEIQHYFREGKDALMRHRRGDKPQSVSSLDISIGEGQTTRLDLVADNYCAATISVSEETQALIDRLIYPYREAMILVYLNGLNQKEAAAWFDCAEITIGRWLEAARLDLRQSQQVEKLRVVSYKRSRNALPYRDDLGALHIPEIKQHCAVCDRIFGLWARKYALTKHNTPKTCSSVCTAQLNPGISSWTASEVQFLSAKIGKMPASEIIEKFQLAAKKNKWKNRTQVAIKLKLRKLAKSVKCVDDGWSMSGLATQLDIPRDRIRIWLKRGLEASKIPYGATGRCVIRRASLHRFCVEQLWRFSGIDVEKLAEVLGDRALAEKCSQQPPKVKRIEVQHLQSRKVYASARAAGRALNCNHTFVLREIKRSGNALLKQSHVETGSGQAQSVRTSFNRQNDLEVIDPSRPSRIWRLQHPDGRIFQTNNLSLFATIHGLTSSRLSNLLSGKQSHHKSWTAPC